MFSKSFPKFASGILGVILIFSLNSCSNEEILNSSEIPNQIFHSSAQLNCERSITLSGGEATWSSLESISVTNASNAQKLNSDDVWESIPNGSGTYSCKGLKGGVSFEKSGTFDIDGESVEIECDGDVTIEENLEVSWSIEDTISVLSVTNAQVLNIDDEWISISDTTTECLDIKGFRVEADSVGSVKFDSPENQGFYIITWFESEE
ncbi:MAG: hypothetical protein DWQ06_13690 [Calditrichaeota bacterium]|nr:MAG: hypothetical protein DWQ06_13690 [Calditrichota bacterium]